ncbi:MAG: hypothetical protein KA257_01630 [Opitutaceae bacterium]|nr:hypothetical protein [Opitutaceae bacterium]MBP9913981.1 hypothetical protein [Opitutaceae bacterium]
MKAAEIISEIKGLPPGDYAEVSAYMLRAEHEDPALQTALQRKRESGARDAQSVPYAQSRAQALAALRAP